MRTSQRIAILIFAVVLLCPSQTLGQGALGEIHCPCVTATWPQLATLETFLASANLPSGYGTQGCQAYDAVFNQSGCSGRGEQPAYCANDWCYVDQVACGLNKTQCWAAGLMLNDPSHPACRSRPMDKSTILAEAAPAYYSYQTCGSLNNYDVSRHQDNMRGTKIIATTTHDLPYTTRTEKPGNGGGQPVVTFGGVQVDFMLDVMGHFQPALEMEVVDGWATAGSRAKFSSSFTAAVHDVALGNFDIAIADFWVTSERMLLTNFLPAVRSDNFYLIVFEEGGATTFSEMLQNPFKPFTGDAWAIIAAAVVVSATAMAIVDFHDDEEFPYEHKSILARAGKALYLGFGSLMSGGSMFSASSMSAKIVTLGFQLFLVITMASYTANLASILVVANVKSGVNGIDDAIDMGLVVCVPAAVERTVVLNYPSLKTYIFGGSTTDFARLMHAGLCDATIIHQKRIDQLHSGEIHDIDCKAVADGDLTEEEGMCVNGKGGAPRDDCSMLRVGDSIFNVPVAFPIRPGDTNLLTALSWALTDAQRSGEWEAATVSNAALFPQSRCSSAAVSSAQLGWDAFAGASFFALAAAVLAVTLHFSKRHAWNRAPVKGDSDGTADGTHVLREESDESAVNVKSAGAGLAGSDTGRAELAFHSEGGLGEVGVQQGRGVAVPVGQSADATSPQTQQQLDRILLQLDRLEKSVQQSNTARRPEPARPPPVAPSKERRGPSSGLRLEPTAPTPSDDDGQQHCDGGRRASGGSAQPRERTGSMPWDDWGLPWGDAASKN